ncbi:hypothetical protein M0657_011840 [Pyricularia oryzae]|uniref:Uncharacterized protein n=1 Tax=Pyricularia oryzae (strain Y34) TaxID=1143189 RepID=A0AA97NNW7_PYRO3|nr:hypothetical protein OOU_Y34scaffold00920g2 [Pyricularia oryzae Y34]KAI7909257.1 hypothetical protein M9X92_011733 [Pyricularia oryzae]KAI7909419.1 hypothetical protein M0657_011840 [Pyricularia oryzae]
MQIQIQIILLALAMASTTTAGCSPRGPGSPIGPFQKCPSGKTYCAGRPDDIFGVCCDNKAGSQGYQRKGAAH